MTAITHLARVASNFALLGLASSAAAQETPARTMARTTEAAEVCPVMGEIHVRKAAKQPPEEPMANDDWWPNRLNLEILHQNSAKSDPMGEGLRLRRGVSNSRPGGW